jgi:hypothetical protein
VTHAREHPVYPHFEVIIWFYCTAKKPHSQGKYGFDMIGRIFVADFE